MVHRAAAWCLCLLPVLAACASLAVFVPASAGAAEPTPDAALWRVAVPVADQGRASRRAAEREAFARLLVRISGRDSVLAVPALQAALRTPQRYYTASGYARRDALDRREDPDDRPWLLQMEFDAGAVTALLARAGVPVWTSRRPEFVVWVLAEDAQGQRRLIGAEEPIGALLLARAEQRGLEVFLPSLDLTDLATFPLAQAWAGFDDATDRASRRYGIENALTLRLYPDPLGRWLADWSGVIAGARVAGTLEAADPAAGAQGALDAVADALADRFAVSVGTSEGVGSLWLQVDRIDAVDRYARLMRYLDGIDGVVDVQLVQMQGASLLLRIDVSDDARRLLDRLRVDGRLVPEAAAERVGGVGVWRARWSDADR